MSFHLSGCDFVLDGATLRAKLRNVDGEEVDAEINLNDFIGNDDGESRQSTLFSRSG